MATTTVKKTFKWPSGTSGHTISWQAQQQRTKTAKLNAPIVPGSSTTERQLAQAASNAMKVKYGPLEAQQQQALGQATNAARDIGGPGGFYDQYLQQLAAHQANVNAQQQQAAQQVQNTQNAVTGLAQADLSGIQGQANAGAAARGMGPAGDQTALANQAAAVRQALVGSFVAQQAQTGAAANTYADTLAHVVGPGQKLAGQAVAAGKTKAAQEDITTTARQKGADTASYEDTQRANEAKNVLAQQIATGKTAAQLAAESETVRSHKAQESIDRTRISAETTKAKNAAATAGSKTILGGAFQGKTQAWLSSASDAQKQALIDAYDSKHGGKKGSKAAAGAKGPDWQTQAQQGTGLTQTKTLQRFAQLAHDGKPFDPAHAKGWKGQKLSRADAEAKVAKAAGSQLKNPVLARAAVDAVYDDHLSAYTVKQLIAAGYKPSEVASALATTTHGEWLKTPAGQAWLRTQRNTKAYGNQGNLGQSGHK